MAECQALRKWVETYFSISARGIRRRFRRKCWKGREPWHCEQSHW